MKFENLEMSMVQLFKTEQVLLNMYEIAVLEEKYFRVFQGAYNDFRLKARTDYKFEIDPLSYEDFIDSFKAKHLPRIYPSLSPREHFAIFKFLKFNE